MSLYKVIVIVPDDTVVLAEYLPLHQAKACASLAAEENPKGIIVGYVPQDVY